MSLHTAVVCSILGRGVLPSLDYAAERLIVPGARVVPAAVLVSCLHDKPPAISHLIAAFSHVPSCTSIF